MKMMKERKKCLDLNSWEEVQNQCHSNSRSNNRGEADQSRKEEKDRILVRVLKGEMLKET